MKSLRGKIFIFVSLVLIFPALPLSYFIVQLLDESYSIGVNPSVEEALDGALELSAAFYRQQKERFTFLIAQASQRELESLQQVEKMLSSEFPASKIELIFNKPASLTQKAIDPDLVDKFLQQKQDYVIWPSADRFVLNAFLKISGGQVAFITSDLPQTFKKTAPQIQEVNQIYKTLGLVNTEIRKSFLFTFLLIYGIGLLLALSLSYFISRKITQPIEKLKLATTSIGSGDLDYQIDVSGQDEFALLAESFNKMVKELKSNQRQIIELEKMASWQQLARRLAHEIKNPLTPIQLMAQQIEDKYDGGDTSYKKMLAECSSIIRDEVGSLKKLVHEFSDFARMPEFQPVQQDAKTLLEALKTLYRDSIEIQIPAESVELPFDFDYLKRALLNLVDNALAAQDSNQKVKITMKRMNQKVIISVKDSGDGIAAENLQKIFEPYYSTKRSGVGLGLSIVKKIIEEHGGTITVKSESGKGTEFTVSLPFDGKKINEL